MYDTLRKLAPGRRARSTLTVTGLILAVLAIMAVPALADAPNPIVGTTQGTVSTNADGTVTVRVFG